MGDCWAVLVHYPGHPCGAALANNRHFAPIGRPLCPEEKLPFQPWVCLALITHAVIGSGEGLADRLRAKKPHTSPLGCVPPRGVGLHCGP